jgi:hypothetical protein
MKALAAYIMRSPMHAMAVVAGFSLLSMIIPPFSYLSSAGVALVTLRNGLQQGFILVFGAGLITGVLGYLISGSAAVVSPTLVSLAILALTIWVLAGVLRYTRSLNYTFIAAGGVGLLLILGARLILGEPQLWWEDALKEIFLPALQQASEAEQQQFEQIITNLASYFTGILAASLVLNGLVCLFLGRWWQALLYNPGGFRQEFHQLRLGRAMAMVTAAVSLLAFVNLGLLSDLANDLLIVLLNLYLLQSVAIVHAVVSIKNLNTGWLVGFYVMTLFLSLTLGFIGLVLIALTGFMDTWLDFRKRALPAGGA